MCYCGLSFCRCLHDNDDDYDDDEQDCSASRRASDYDKVSVVASCVTKDIFFIEWAAGWVAKLAF